MINGFKTSQSERKFIPFSLGKQKLAVVNSHLNVLRFEEWNFKFLVLFYLLNLLFVVIISFIKAYTRQNLPDFADIWPLQRIFLKHTCN